MSKAIWLRHSVLRLFLPLLVSVLHRPVVLSPGGLWCRVGYALCACAQRIAYLPGEHEWDNAPKVHFLLVPPQGGVGETTT